MQDKVLSFKKALILSISDANLFEIIQVCIILIFIYFLSQVVFFNILKLFKPSYSEIHSYAQKILLFTIKITWLTLKILSQILLKKVKFFVIVNAIVSSLYK